MQGAASNLSDAWRRSRRRRALLIALVTLALTMLVGVWLTRPTILKWQARGWVQTPAKLENVRRGYADAKADLLLGKRLEIRFSYLSPAGERITTEQNVSASWAAEQSINSDGRYVVRTIGGSDRPWERLHCFVDPSHPERAVLERGFTRGDVAALAPLFVLLIGSLLVMAERRGALAADVPGERQRLRNEGGWQMQGYGGSLHAVPTRQVTPDGLFWEALCAFPPVAIEVSPHPLVIGGRTRVRLSLDGKPGRVRRVRATLMVGRFNNSGRRRFASWSHEVWNGRLVAGEWVDVSIELPHRGDLPHDAEDCWLRVTGRTRLGFAWSRVLWLRLEGRADA